jgi:hypothetical protein
VSHSPARSAFRRRLVAVATTAALVFGGTFLATAPANADSVLFPDAELKECVQDKLGSTLGALLDTLGLSALKILLVGPLTCTGTGVTSLLGLGQFTGLTAVNLNGNAITDLSPLKTLTGTTISATGQVVELDDAVGGVATTIPIPRDINGNLVTLTSTGTDGVTGMVDLVAGTVTWLGAGVGELTWAVGSFTGTLIQTILQPNLPSSATATISGTTAYGSTLTAGTEGFPDGTTYTYAWSRAGVPVAGATASTFELGSADIGERHTVTIVASKEGYNSRTVTSEESHTVRKGTIATAGTPEIVGTPTVGQQLAVVVPSWSDGVAVTLQWKRGKASIAGATSSFYTPTAADLGAALSVTATGSRDGYTTVSRTSVASALVVKAPAVVEPPVTPVTPIDPVVPMTPVVPVTPVVPDSASVQDLVPVVTAPIVPTTPAAALKKFARTPVPVISGKTTVGKTLTAKTTKWNKKAKFSYQWKASGKKIAKATGKTYKVAAKYAGKKITVTITAKLSGYSSVTKTSKATKRIAA